MYGEWLREQFDKGAIPEPTYDPDLAILLSQLRENSINLFGPEATEVIEPVPMTPADRKSTRLNSSHTQKSRMPSSA